MLDISSYCCMGERRISKREREESRRREEKEEPLEGSAILDADRED